MAINTGDIVSEGREDGANNSLLKRLGIDGAISATRNHAAGALAGLSILVGGAAAAEEDKSFQVALNGDEGVVALLAEQENFTLPTEIAFSNGAGESFVVSGDQEALFTAWSLQQVFTTIPSQFRSQVEQNWLALSTTDMQTALAIHAGTQPLEGESLAHEFYHEMLRSFLELGREYYIQNAPTSDPEGWEGYSPTEISEDWDDFMEKYSEGVTNTDLDYRVEGNPDFFRGMSIFFPNHPVTAEIQKELSIIMAELDGQVAELDGQVAELIKIRDSLRALNATLGSANETVTN